MAQNYRDEQYRRREEERRRSGMRDQGERNREDQRWSGGYQPEESGGDYPRRSSGRWGSEEFGEEARGDYSRRGSLSAYPESEYRHGSLPGDYGRGEQGGYGESQGWRQAGRSGHPQDYGRNVYGPGSQGQGGARDFEQERYGAGDYRQEEWGGDWRGQGGRSSVGPGQTTQGNYGYGPGGSRGRWSGGIGGEQNRRGKGPKSYKRTDERIKEDVHERLINEDDIDASEVTIDVKDGKVSLEGTVPERWMKHTVEDIADGCWGVQDIENRIRVARGSAAGETSIGGEGSVASTASGGSSSSGASGSSRSKKE